MYIINYKQNYSIVKILLTLALLINQDYGSGGCTISLHQMHLPFLKFHFFSWKKISYCDEIEPFSQIVKEAFHCCLKLFKTCLEKRLWLWGWNKWEIYLEELRAHCYLQIILVILSTHTSGGRNWGSRVSLGAPTFWVS